MTAIIYFGEMLVACLFATMLVASSASGAMAVAAQLVAGAILWTLAEYVVHRFVLHHYAPTAHGLHHANPDQPVQAIFWQIWLCFGLVYWFGGGALLAGALIAYAWYLLVHHRAHQGAGNRRFALLRHDQTHHRFANRNFGVSTRFWDHVFGTVGAEIGAPAGDFTSGRGALRE